MRRRIGVLAGMTLVVYGLLAPKPALGDSPPWRAYLAKPDEWYRGPEGRHIAGSILSHQSERGSWPKNIDTTSRPFEGPRNTLKGTFDNGATVPELRFLARAHQATGDVACLRAFLAGLDHVLNAQGPAGGWPQSFPPGPGYARHITFNDGVMAHVLDLVGDAGKGGPDRPFPFLDETRRKRADRSFEAGLDCLLRCQVQSNGRLTIWAAQHDELTLEPRWGRSFEPPSLASAESAGVLRLLMRLDRPTAEVRRAIEAGVAWFQESQVRGIRQVRRGGDKKIIPDPDAPHLWARFYEIATNRPVFCGRDGVIKYDLSGIEPERRNGYAWYGDWGHAVALDYRRWRGQVGADNP